MPRRFNISAWDISTLRGLLANGRLAHPAALRLDGVECVFGFFDAFQYGQPIASNGRRQYGFTGIHYGAARIPVQQ